MLNFLLRLIKRVFLLLMVKVEISRVIWKNLFWMFSINCMCCLNRCLTSCLVSFWLLNSNSWAIPDIFFLYNYWLLFWFACLLCLVHPETDILTLGSVMWGLSSVLAAGYVLMFLFVLYCVCLLRCSLSHADSALWTFLTLGASSWVRLVKAAGVNSLWAVTCLLLKLIL